MGSAAGGRGGAGGFSGPTIGDMEGRVKLLPNRAASTRTWSRVGTGTPLRTSRTFSSRFGSLTLSIFFVLLSDRTSTTFAPLRLKATVFLPMPVRKLRPRSVSVWPTNTFFGATCLTTGALAASAVAVPATAGTRSALSAAIWQARRSMGRVRARYSIAPDIGGRPPELERYWTTVSSLVVPVSTRQPSSVTTTRSSIRTPPRPGR